MIPSDTPIGTKVWHSDYQDGFAHPILGVVETILETPWFVLGRLLQWTSHCLTFTSLKKRLLLTA